MLEPAPRKRVALLLKECESGNSEAWWRLNIEMTLEPTSTHFGDSLESEITKLPGWLSADTETRIRIIAAAEKYLIEQDSNVQQWFGTNLIYHPAFAGYRALRLIAEEDPQFLSEMPPAIWRIWSPIILAFPLSSGEKSERNRRELIIHAYRHAPLAILNAVSILIDKENLEYERISVLTAINCCWDNRLAELVLMKAKDSRMKPKCMGSLLSTLLAHDSSEARSFAESLITTRTPSTDIERARRIVAAQIMLVDAHDAGWPSVWPAIQDEVEFGKEVIQGIGHDWPSIGLRLNEEQLADLYIWLYRHFPPPILPSGGAHWVGPLEEIDMWRNGIINGLEQRGTYRTCDAIRKLQSELPELEWLKWVLADVQDETRRITWVPPRPDAILKLTDNPELRLIQNGHQLLEVTSVRMLIEQIQLIGRNGLHVIRDDVVK